MEFRSRVVGRYIKIDGETEYVYALETLGTAREIVTDWTQTTETHSKTEARLAINYSW